MLKLHRRFFRFSISTLLLVVTVLCIWLAAESICARNQARIVANIERARGMVFFQKRFGNGIWMDNYGQKKIAADNSIPPKVSAPAPTWATNALGEHYFVYPGYVAIHISENKESLLQDLKSLNTLRHLDITGINESDLAVIEPLLPHLWRLDLGDDQITDSSIPMLAKLQGLKKLDLAGTSISPQGIAKLKALLPNCLIMDANYSEIPGQVPPMAAPNTGS